MQIYSENFPKLINLQNLYPLAKELPNIFLEQGEILLADFSLPDKPTFADIQKNC